MHVIGLTNKIQTEHKVRDTGKADFVI